MNSNADTIRHGPEFGLSRVQLERLVDDQRAEIERLRAERQQVISDLAALVENSYDEALREDFWARMKEWRVEKESL